MNAITDWIQDKELAIPGVLFSHDYVETVSRPDGAQTYLFLHFSSEIDIRSIGGRKLHSAGTWILYAPGSPQWYGLQGKKFHHDWLFITGEIFEQLHKCYKIPIDTVIPTSNGTSISSIVKQIALEIFKKEKHWNRHIAVLLESLCIVLTRDVTSKEQLSPRQLELRKKLDKIRMEIQSAPENKWPISKLAQKACMSQSRFTVVYKQIYGMSPIKDINDTRIKKAASLLKSTAQPLKNIASDLGFEDVAYFHRVFTRYMRCKPGEYRRDYDQHKDK